MTRTGVTVVGRKDRTTYNKEDPPSPPNFNVGVLFWETQRGYKRNRTPGTLEPSFHNIEIGGQGGGPHPANYWVFDLFVHQLSGLTFFSTKAHASSCT